jgi:hypothetical protein
LKSVNVRSGKRAWRSHTTIRIHTMATGEAPYSAGNATFCS